MTLKIEFYFVTTGGLVIKMARCNLIVITQLTRARLVLFRLLLPLLPPACENYLNFDKVLLRVGQPSYQQSTRTSY